MKSAHSYYSISEQREGSGQSLNIYIYIYLNPLSFQNSNSGGQLNTDIENSSVKHF